jgi:hypothetical protein
LKGTREEKLWMPFKKLDNTRSNVILAIVAKEKLKKQILHMYAACASKTSVELNQRKRGKKETRKRQERAKKKPRKSQGRAKKDDNR